MVPRLQLLVAGERFGSEPVPFLRRRASSGDTRPNSAPSTWARQTYLSDRISFACRDLTELEGAIALPFGGFDRGRLPIGAIYGLIICLAAVVLGVPYGALSVVIAGLIVFIR